MRIAQIAPLAESVPPKFYGGTERVVAWLVDELVGLGHEVTLFASGDSRTRAKLYAAWPQALRLGRPRTDPTAACAALLEAVAQHASEFDVIHAHIDWMHLPLLQRLNVPFLTTMHGRLDLPGLPHLVRAFATASFVSISNNQRLPLGKAKWLGTIYHGLPADLFQPSYERGDYLAFLGRLTADKGPEAAIRIARAAGMPLRIAAKLPRAERHYFKERLEPQIDGQHIRLIGEVNDRTKQQFLAGAAALLFPIDWPEPFGLVMIEAMACGTPVIAFRSGSVPEVIDEGITGFVVETEEEAVQAIRRLDKLSRHGVRAQFERRFTAKRMAQDYVAHYRALIDARPRHLTMRHKRSVLHPIELPGRQARPIVVGDSGKNYDHEQRDGGGNYQITPDELRAVELTDFERECAGAIDPPEIPPPTPGIPTEPPPENPPGNPGPDIPPVQEPVDPPPPDNLPGITPDEIPPRGPGVDVS
jgi:glycosyltransferase involved in cell wall biosynthesis